MSDELVSLGKSGSVADAPLIDARAPYVPVSLPHVVELPTRYYGRLAVAETLHAFAEVATVELKVEEGVLRLTFTRLDESAGDVIAELLNHALYSSAIAGPELLR